MYLSCSGDLKLIKIIGQRKAFSRQRIPDSSCARTETVDKDIFLTSKKEDRKIVQTKRVHLPRKCGRGTNSTSSDKYLRK